MSGVNNESSQLSLLDSSKVSNSERSGSNETIDQLRARLRQLESENNEFKRILPRLRDAQGDDITEWAATIVKVLEDTKLKYSETDEKRKELAQRFCQFREKAQKDEQQYKMEIAKYKEKAENLERQNQELKNEIRDQESRIFHLQENVNADGNDNSDREDQNFEECLHHIQNRSESDNGSEHHSHSRQSTARTERPDSAKEIALESITLALFEKLRTTVDFFASFPILSDVCEDPEQRQLIEKIRNLNLDLNRSMEALHKRLVELKRTPPPSSADNSYQQRPENQLCTKCQQLENERDTLRAQLNKEIALKESSVEELRNRIEELKSDLQLSKSQVEKLEQKLQRTEQFYQEKYVGKKSEEVIVLEQKIQELRQQILALNEKNANIFIEYRNYKESYEKLQADTKSREKLYNNKVLKLRELLKMYVRFHEETVANNAIFEQLEIVLQEKIDEIRRHNVC